jgi:L-cysteine S-thiosulfotransferase
VRRALALFLVALPAFAEPTGRDVEKVMQRDFHPRGQAKMDRVVQDGVQRVCTESGDRPPAELAKTLEAGEMKTIVFPEGSLLGDWKRGEAIAQSGRGMQYSDDPAAPTGANCYACHRLAPQELSFGTMGPSLYQFGKSHGYTDEARRYAYGKIYNAEAYSACTNMPRFGHKGILSEQQIKDVVALLMDPDSPVNK